MVSLPFRRRKTIISLLLRGRDRVGVGLIRCLFKYGLINKWISFEGDVDFVSPQRRGDWFSAALR